MEAEAMGVVAQGSFGAPMTQSRVAYMRYVGQGHEIPVPLPARPLNEEDVALIRAAYDTEYTKFYDRPVPGSDVEIMSYAVVVATVPNDDQGVAGATDDAVFARDATPARIQLVRDTTTGEVSPWSVYDRTTLAPGARIVGPAIIAEDETSTLVSQGWSATVNGLGYIGLTHEIAPQELTDVA
jgi:N-methylhydantoinase A